MTLELTYLGTHWHWSGDLYFLKHDDGREARIYVDSIGETWVDIRRIPEGGFFHSERVEAYRVHTGSARAVHYLIDKGFTDVRVAHGAHRVRERD